MCRFKQSSRKRFKWPLRVYLFLCSFATSIIKLEKLKLHSLTTLPCYHNVYVTVTDIKNTFWLWVIHVLRSWVTLNSKAMEFRECFTSDLPLNANTESELWNLICLNGTNVSEDKDCVSCKEQRHSYHIYFVGVIVYPLSLEDFLLTYLQTD